MGNQSLCICLRNTNTIENSNIKVPEIDSNDPIEDNKNNNKVQKDKIKKKKRAFTQKLNQSKKTEYLIYKHPELSFVTIHKKLDNINKTIAPTQQINLNKNLKRNIIYIGIFGAKNSGKKSLYYKLFNGYLKTMDNFDDEEYEFLMNTKKYFYNNILYDLNITLYCYKEDNIYNYGKQLDYFIIMYDIGDYNSFEIGKQIIEYFVYKGYASGEKIIFLANKIDLYNKKQFNNCKIYCENNCFSYYNISIKNECELLNEIIDNIVSNFEKQLQ